MRLHKLNRQALVPLTCVFSHPDARMHLVSRRSRMGSQTSYGLGKSCGMLGIVLQFVSRSHFLTRIFHTTGMGTSTSFTDVVHFRPAPIVPPPGQSASRGALESRPFYWQVLSPVAALFFVAHSWLLDSLLVLLMAIDCSTVLVPPSCLSLCACLYY